MSTATDPSALDGIPPEARDAKTTPFDYIIVGSGAGGAPLACRLARQGMRVLVLEAGIDAGGPPAEDAEAAQDGGGDGDAAQMQENRHAILRCPGLYPAASEPREHPETPDELQMSWDFEVRHYSDDAMQDADLKAGPDPYVPGRKSVFYPRCSSLGGCTSHHAMVTVYGTHREWRRIVELTGDQSWSPENMRRYYQRIERACYGSYRTHLGKLWERFVQWVAPGRLARSRRGNAGWLDVTITDPEIALSDKQLLRMILDAALDVELKGWRSAWRWIKRILAGRLYRDLDPNDAAKIRGNLEGVAFVPLAASGGMRHGPREYLLQTRLELQPADAASGDACGTQNRRAEEVGKLNIATGVFVKRVIFENTGEALSPRAVGVEFSRGRHLYQASPLHSDAAPVEEGQCFAKREVILCGGAFNTPQLLMLSGIGDPAELAEFDLPGPRDKDGNAVSDVIRLPGVGKNLCDRYEVSIVSEMKNDFSVLNGVSFDPTATDDVRLNEWKQTRTGLYATNGSAIAILKKSHPDLDEPDLFMLGFPAAFRGYYHGWSKELLRDRIGGEEVRRNFWSWAILKAYSNNRGTVSLRSANPYEVPEINFRYFNDGQAHSQADDEADARAVKAATDDLRAVMSGVAYTRRINKQAADLIREELQPGQYVPNDSELLQNWVKQQAWGHHACGTCRLGKDDWCARTDELTDPLAVIDSKFRVHGVQGLRIVDASIFPEIPGYFIATPIYMVSEKAADAVLEDSTVYPPELQRAEAVRVHQRRTKAGTVASSADDAVRDELPQDTVGLALSGGGIRSATFSLGILQALAHRGRLREVDFLSTISGGGYIGSFLGRLFTRPNVSGDADPCGVVENTLRNSRSAPLQWLRSHADYLTGAGASDLRQGLAVFWRNLFTIYFVLACLGVAAFGLLRLASELLPDLLQPSSYPPQLERIVPLQVLSPWWCVPPALFLLCVMPASLAYWLSPKVGSRAFMSVFPAMAWIVVLAGLVIGATLPGGTMPCLILGVVGLAMAGWLEVSRLKSRKRTASLGRKEPAPGALLRNRLTRALGTVTVLLILSLGWVLLDTLARAFAQQRLLALLMAVAALLAPFMPFLRSAAESLLKEKRDETGKRVDSPKRGALMAAAIAFPLAAFLLVLVDGAVHRLFESSLSWGIGATALGTVLTLLLGMAFDFLNFSSLQQTYAARFSRTFLGASNPHRISVSASDASADVQQVEAEDDVRFDDYHPECAGGPLHLIGVCVNETVDVASQREIRDRKGILMSVGPCGLSVGRRYHGLWTDPPKHLSWFVRVRSLLDANDAIGRQGAAVRGIPVPGQAFHVLRGKDDTPIPVENLGLSSWVAISGAAAGTASGRTTSLPVSLLCGLANLRLGYWWDTRLEYIQRPGRFRQNVWRRMLAFPAFLTRMQSLLLAEFRARFNGPGARFWYLSDGGHFDHTGIYELIRRRTPFILAVDAGADPKRTFATSGDLIRQVRIDFGAEVEYLEPTREAAPDGTSSDVRMAAWQAFDEPDLAVDDLVKRWIDPDSLGAISELGVPGGKHAALARITYADDPQKICWLVLLKTSLTGDEPLDVQTYHSLHPSFPNESTTDQFFDEAQWESYRKLGEAIGLRVVTQRR